MPVRVLFGAALAAFLLAAAQAATPCIATASSPWPAAGEDYVVEAVSGGSTSCDGATAVSVRSSGGDLIWTEAQVTSWNDFLAGAADSADLTKRLAELVDQSKAAFKTSADLPDWKKGAEAPLNKDGMPFFVEATEGGASGWYESVRAEKYPLLCFRQAVHYLGCYALVSNGPQDQTLMKIGQLQLPSP